MKTKNRPLLPEWEEGGGVIESIIPHEGRGGGIPSNLSVRGGGGVTGVGWVDWQTKLYEREGEIR